MLKVLHYCPGFLYGGIESMYLGWYRNMDKNRVKLELLLRTQDDNASALAEYRKLGGVYYRLPKLSMKSILRFRRAVELFFQAHHDYDILHANSFADPFVLQCAKKYGIKHIIIHSHSADCVPKDWKYRIGCIFKWQNKRFYADKAFACSALAAQFAYGGLTFKNEPVTIIRNGIDAEKYRFSREIREKVRSAMGLCDAFVIGHVGRMTYPKNQFYLLDIFRCVCKRNEDAVLLMIGDGPDETALRAYADELGISDKVRFLGVRSDVAALLQAMDVFLLPSRWEGLPVTLVEAEAAGLPCVIADVISDEADITDLVVRRSIQDKPEDWAEDILRLRLTRKDTLQQIRNAGYDIHTTAKWLEEFYLNMGK